MVNWYMKGQSDYISANFHMGFYIDHSGFAEGDYDTQDMETHGATSDPFMAFGIDTGPATWTYGQQQVEIGLLKSHRLKFDTTGSYKWIGPGQDDWALIEASGSAGNLGDLDDVVISGTPAEDELLAWDTTTSKWINQTGGEAGLSLSGHTHGQLHDESHSLASHSSEAHSELTGYNDETDVKHLTDSQLGALHTLYTLESHDNAYHSTNYEVYNANIQSHVASPVTDAHHTLYTLEQHNNSFHSTNFHSETDGTGVVTVHSDVTSVGSGAIITTGERGALHPQLTNLTELATRNHNDLLNINAGDSYEHITQTQKNLLHSIYTLEVHDNTEHDPDYHTESAGTGVVTVHSDVTSVGSGAIITTGERNALHAAVTQVYNLKALDDRDFKPDTTSTYGFIKGYFTSLGGMTGVADSDYQDLLILNTYTDGTGGDINALTFDKSEKLIKHWLADQTDSTWGTPETLAYVSNITTAINLLKEQSSTFPVSPNEGDLHYDEDDDSLYRYNAEALAWVEVGAGGLISGENDVNKAYVNGMNWGYSLNTPARSASSTGGYVLLKQTTLTVDMPVLNISWEDKSDNGSFVAYTKVYVNEIAISDAFTIWRDTYAKQTYTLTGLSATDRVQIYGSSASHTVYAQNLVLGEIGTIHASY